MGNPDFPRNLPAGAVFNPGHDSSDRTVLECLINSKIHYRELVVHRECISPSKIYYNNSSIKGGDSVARSKVGQVRRRTQIRQRQKRRLKRKKLALKQTS